MWPKSTLDYCNTLDKPCQKTILNQEGRLQCACWKILTDTNAPAAPVLALPLIVRVNAWIGCLLSFDLL